MLNVSLAVAHRRTDRPPSSPSTPRRQVIECVLASILFGITLTQTAVYYQHCWGQDHYILIWGIGFLWVLGFMHQFTLTWTVFTFTVTEFGQFSSLAFIPWYTCLVKPGSSDLKLILFHPPRRRSCQPLGLSRSEPPSPGYSPSLVKSTSLGKSGF